jgi:hypothetical protein
MTRPLDDAGIDVGDRVLARVDELAVTGTIELDVLIAVELDAEAGAPTEAGFDAEADALVISAADAADGRGFGWPMLARPCAVGRANAGWVDGSEEIIELGAALCMTNIESKLETAPATRVMMSRVEDGDAPADTLTNSEAEAVTVDTAMKLSAELEGTTETCAPLTTSWTGTLILSLGVGTGGGALAL